MNYIKKLQEENKILQDFKDELLSYLSSSKFSGPNLNDKMVNRNDIILRIHELENNLNNEVR